MIHLAIDGNEANIPNRVGSNVYAYQILQELSKLIKKDTQVKATVLLSHPPIKDMPSSHNKWQYQVITPSKFWTQLALPIFLFKNQARFSLFFTPGHYAPRFSAVPYISSVMDLAFLHFPEQFKLNDLLQLKHWTAYSVKHAKKVVTISQFSRNEIVNFYHKTKADILIAYPGTNLSQPASKAEETRFTKKFRLDQPYFLYLGTLQPRKNIINLINGFENFIKENSHLNKQLPNLVIAGKIGWLAQPIINKISQSPTQQKIVLTDYVPENIKGLLYKNSVATLLVGLYEGFGIPALEAMKCGSLPIVSNSSSLPEVVGKAGLLVNPLKPDSIAQALAKSWQMQSQQKQQYQAQMQVQLQKFSWQKSALKIFELLKAQASS